MSRAGILGVRVIKEAKGSIDRLKPEDILFEKMKPKTEEKVFVQDIDDAPVCHAPNDLFVGEARATINRLFRNYLDKNNLTATELLHAPREIKRVLEEGTLLFSAVGKVSTFQVRKMEDTTVNQRRDVLFDFINKINARAIAASEQRLPRIRVDGFNTVVEGIVAKVSQEHVSHLIRYVMSVELVENRSFLGKFGQLMEWAWKAEAPQALEAIDIFVSDTLYNVDVLRDMIGNPRELGTALVTLLCVAEGRPLVEEEEEEEPVELTPEHQEFANATFIRLIAAGKLPESKAVLVDRVRRQLEGLSPLTRGDREEEREVFIGLLDKLIPDIEIIGGPSMAQAMTARQSTIINKGGSKGMREAAETMLPALGDPGRATGYLLAMMDSEIGQTVLRNDLETLLDKLLVHSKTINHLIRDKLPPNKKMAKVTSIYHHIQKSNLPPQRKAALTERLDELLVSYITEGKILDKLDNPEKPLHVRAFMLVSMVQPEMLPKGKASDLARNIIVGHLRRANFEDELVAAIPDPSEKAKTLRKFHEQLHRCGFFG
ncbi:hypothetical protein T8K17_22185 [Thalassobaculum sp. OXR-137]|uniref:hypothetical protein n=1 Tax=Thalassobaculum sp. OXR-137 TaxID=3100173 RepID=UPI002AC9DC5E|nr:hypothetical protein [Thalassobaculum sp. OXR-137]WPZ33936.1 hypothetical protein T8K17_22185 [Thalassobaculum sp. OXR-137]